MSTGAEMQQRLERIEEKLDDLCSKVAGYCAECRLDRATLNRVVTKHDETIHGNGDSKKGLVSRLSTLEHAEDNRSKHFWVVWTAIVGTMATAVYSWFHKVP